jgi:hypothetical protein
MCGFLVIASSIGRGRRAGSRDISCACRFFVHIMHIN